MEIFILLINVCLCLWVGSAASKKNRSPGGWVFLSLLISPMLGGIGLLIAGEKQEVDKS